jgi:hypothetical protein
VKVKELAILSLLVSGDTTELDLDSAVSDGDGSEAASQEMAILISCLAKTPVDFLIVSRFKPSSSFAFEISLCY